MWILAAHVAGASAQTTAGKERREVVVELEASAVFNVEVATSTLKSAFLGATVPPGAGTRSGGAVTRRWVGTVVVVSVMLVAAGAASAVTTGRVFYLPLASINA